MKEKLFVKFSDELGIVCVHVDYNGVSFGGGFAYFTSEKTGEDFKVDISHIHEINTFAEFEN